MPLVTAVSFDDDGIKVVTGKRNRDGFTVAQMQHLAHDDLPAFLAADRSTEYLVCLNTPDSLYELIQIPPVGANLMPGIIRTELRRLHPELADFSFAYRAVGDIPQEGKTVRKVACCLIANTVITTYLQPFIQADKTVRQMMTASTALANLVLDNSELSSLPVLCAHDASRLKTFFLLENGAVLFARHVSSDQTGWSAVDRQNISMTMDYCFQALRIRPERVIVMNNLADGAHEGQFPRLQPFELPERLAKIDQAAEFLIPLAAVRSQARSEDNLLPAGYQTATRQYRSMRYAYALSLFCSAVLITLLSYHIATIHDLKTTIRDMQQGDAGLAASYQAYLSAKASSDALIPALTAQNSILSAPSIPHLLQTLGSLKQERVSLNLLSLKQEPTSIAIKLSGTISGKTLTETQQSFDGLKQQLTAMPGVAAGGGAIDFKNGTFSLESVYKP